MRIILLLAAALLFTFKSYAQDKPPVIVLTDIGGDPDDQQSLVRFLLYSNEYDVKAICATSSLGHGQEVHTRIIKDQVTAYGKVYPNLIANAKGFPSPEYLQSVVFAGQGNQFDFGKGFDTDASNQIIKIVEASDKPVNILIWGGQRELAQALWKVRETQSKEQLASFCKKIQVYAIGDQDDHEQWILKNFRDVGFVSIGYAEIRNTSTFRGMYVTGNTSLQDSNWVKTNVYGHGPLSEHYPLNGAAVNGMKEGDTPSFLNFIQNGLNFYQHPEWGGWGGRYRKVKALSFFGLFIDAPDLLDGTLNERHSVSRWRPDFQRDFMARLDWCIKPYDKANHNPIVVVNGSMGHPPLYINAKRGERVEFNAGKSTDPDGDQLSYHWFIYDEISGTLGQCMELKTSKGKCSFRVPEISGDTIHLILAVRDNGIPSLTTYKRMIIQIKSSDNKNEN